MMTKFQQSWKLFTASLTITFRNPKLLWFPFVTTVLTAFIGLFFISAMALPVVLHSTGFHFNQPEHWLALKNYYVPAGAAKPAFGDPNIARIFPWAPVLMVLIYFGSMFLATFFNVAFYSEIIAALNGKGVSLRRGLDTARNRLPSILAWSLLAGVIGWIIRCIEKRMPLGGRIATGLIGMAWSVAAVFVIPVIIQEQSLHNPLKILQRSAMTLKWTWGQSLIGFLGFSTVTAAMVGCSLPALVAAGALAYVYKSIWLAVIAAAMWFLCICVISYISGVAGKVYRCALYMYATEGVVPEPYNKDLMDMAWRVKATGS
jgi:hypothetical protein